ncbi:MAG: hypothetical protein D4R82_02370 [Dehalococcoidia bacterium]|nr:MAG: hypothetical protein D4R82_02370 [Dehalococcoidia bacterium]
MNKHGSWCNNCVKVCPWTRPNAWNHNLVRWAVQRSSLARRISIKADEFLGYGKGNEQDKWWFDLKSVAGVLTIPQRNIG